MADDTTTDQLTQTHCSDIIHPMDKTQSPFTKAAKLLGSIRTEKKAQAARINGKLGGRPPKRPKDSLTEQEKSPC